MNVKARKLIAVIKPNIQLQSFNFHEPYPLIKNEIVKIV
jgi:hypothetical protein